MIAHVEHDWAFCQQALVEVSRTFSVPIQMLPEPLCRALTCAYLLCRVADTVEDHPALSSKTRDGLFSVFISALDGDLPSDSLSATFSAVADDDPEVRLVQGMPRVMRVYATLPPDTRLVTKSWLAEMANGMRLYCRRDRSMTLSTLHTVSDLERYCYFVAGTVGHLITDLFATFIRPTSMSLEEALRARSESFGMGLQLVNILKDVTDDFARGRCYIPRQLCRAQGFEPEQLLVVDNRPRVHRALSALFSLAAEHLERALEYSLLIPSAELRLRRFCVVPLWMAVETLVLSVGNDALLDPQQQVKISRVQVAGIVEDCLQYASDDEWLRHSFASRVLVFRERVAALQAPSLPRTDVVVPYAQL